MGDGVPPFFSKKDTSLMFPILWFSFSAKCLPFILIILLIYFRTTPLVYRGYDWCHPG